MNTVIGQQEWTMGWNRRTIGIVVSVTMVLLILSLIIGTVASVTLAAMRSIAQDAAGQLPPPPFTYSQDTYLPNTQEVCPGDTITWKSTLSVRTDTRVELRTQIYLWSVEQALPLFPVKVADGSAIGVPHSATFTIGNKYTIPPLAPGDYLLMRFTGKEGTDKASYQVPFHVMTGCTTLPTPSPTPLPR